MIPARKLAVLKMIVLAAENPAEGLELGDLACQFGEKLGIEWGEVSEVLGSTLVETTDAIRGRLTFSLWQRPGGYYDLSLGVRPFWTEAQHITTFEARDWSEARAIERRIIDDRAAGRRPSGS